jgi:integrase
LPVAAIDTPLVLKVLEQKVPAALGHPAGRFWDVRPETANRVRGRIEALMDWATVRGHRTGNNPARWRGFLSEALPHRSAIAVPRHHAALPFVRLPEFIAALRGREGSAARALEFLILTAARSGEVLGATWDEIDLENGIWTIPAGRMKAGKEHRVPLAPRAVELLRGAYRERGNPHVFLGPSKGGLSSMAMAALLKRMHYDEATVHGFRSTFSDWSHERTASANHLIELSLAHAVGSDVERAYRRGDLFDKRRKLMSAWANYCEQPTETGDVIPLRAQS